MHWTTHQGYNLTHAQTLRSHHLSKIQQNADSLYANYEKWEITNPKKQVVLQLIFFPYIQTAEVHDLKNNLTLGVSATSPQEAIQKYFHQAGKTAEQADKKIESRLQYLAR